MNFFRENACAYVLTGWQSISKFNQQEYDRVAILLGLIRLDSVDSDLIITYHCNNLNEKQEFMDWVKQCRIIRWELFEG